ncbi:class I SAM-dependent methyltransferase [Trinickia sp. YCB016]
MSDLKQFGISLQGKTVLDVGSGLGFNAKAMQREGASVFGVEPDSEAHAQALQRSNFADGQSLNGKLQDIPSNMRGKFDLATVFLWNIPHAERDGVMQGLRAALKPGGKVVIGLHDDVYINDPYGVAVQPLAQKYFSQVRATPINDSHTNRQFLICS